MLGFWGRLFVGRVSGSVVEMAVWRFFTESRRFMVGGREFRICLRWGVSGVRGGVERGVVGLGELRCGLLVEY